jgi:hypothetical protein
VGATAKLSKRLRASREKGCSRLLDGEVITSLSRKFTCRKGNVGHWVLWHQIHWVLWHQILRQRSARSDGTRRPQGARIYHHRRCASPLHCSAGAAGLSRISSRCGGEQRIASCVFVSTACTQFERVGYRDLKYLIFPKQMQVQSRCIPKLGLQQCEHDDDSCFRSGRSRRVACERRVADSFRRPSYIA